MSRATSLLWVLALHAVMVAAGHSDVRGDDASDLRALLRAREEAVKTFEADVEVLWRPGSQRKEYTAARARFADWIERRQPELSTRSFRASMARTGESGPTESAKYHYTVGPEGQIRIERISAMGDSPLISPGSRRIHIYNGAHWRSYSENIMSPF
jgi:hypothetical protein